MAASPASPSGPRPGTRERRDQRAERILDVTAELVLRWGYRKTTLDDIARESEVAKGTLFLHWRNRDALFISLLRRERLRMYDSLLDAFSESEPDTLEVVLTRLMTEVIQRPLLRASMLADEEVLGRLVKRKRSSGTTAATRDAFGAYLTRLRELGMIRTDLELDELQAVYTSTYMGFIYAALRVPPLDALDDLPDERRVVELCGQSLQRLLRPVETPEFPAAMAEAFATATIDFLRRAREVALAGYQASLDAVREPATPTGTQPPADAEPAEPVQPPAGT